MKRSARTVVIALLLASFVTIAARADVKLDKIALINIEKVMETVFSGTSGVVQQINQEKEEMQQKLDKIKANIMSVEDKKLSETDNGKKLAYQKKIDELKKQYNDYYKLRKYQIDQKVKQAQGSMFTEIYNVVKKIADREGYSLVLDINTDGIFYYSLDVDITDKVIDYFQGRYGEEEEPVE
jgi:outer membrane protein